MSFLSRQRRPLQRQATIAEADNISIHARLSSPSRKGSLESLVKPSAKERKPTLFNPFKPKKASSLFVNPLGASSQISFFSTVDGKPSELDDETSSTPTLNSTIDGPIAPNIYPISTSDSTVFPPAESRPSPKALQDPIRTSPESEWMGGETGSSKDVDELSVARDKSSTNRNEAASGADPWLNRSSNPLPVILNEQANAHLADELAAAQRKLTLLMDGQTRLQERVRLLEEENKAGAIQINKLQDVARDEKMELLRTHGVQTDNLREEMRSLREDVRSLTRGSLDRDGRLDELNKEILRVHTRAQDCENEIKSMEQTGLQRERLLAEGNNMERESTRQEIRTLQESLQSLMLQIHDKEEVAQLRNNISELRIRLEGNEEKDGSRFGRLQEELAALRESKEKTDAEIWILKGRMDIEGGTIQQLQKKTDTLANEVAAEKEERLEESTQLRHQVNQQLTRRETELETYRKEMNIVSKAVNGSIQEHLDGLEKTSEALKKDMESVGSKAEEYLKDLEKLREVHLDAVDEANRKMKTLEGQVSSYADAIQDLKSDLNANHEEADTTTKSVDELRKEVANLKSECIRLNDFLEQQREAQENQASVARRGQGGSTLMNSLRTLPLLFRSLKSKEPTPLVPV